MVERGLGLQAIDSVRVIRERTRVYNFHCPPVEAYIANGMTVHNCGFCAYRWEGYSSNQLFGVQENGKRNNNPARFIPKEKCFEILDDCAAMGVEAIQFTGGGEPTVHKDHFEIMKYAEKQDLLIALVTHGALLQPPTMEWLAWRATWIRVSIDAGNRDTYSRIRGVSPAQHDRAWANIRSLVMFKKSLRSSMVLGVGLCGDQGELA